MKPIQKNYKVVKIINFIRALMKFYRRLSVEKQ